MAGFEARFCYVYMFYCHFLSFVHMGPESILSAGCIQPTPGRWMDRPAWGRARVKTLDTLIAPFGMLPEAMSFHRCDVQRLFYMEEWLRWRKPWWTVVCGSTIPTTRCPRAPIQLNRNMGIYCPQLEWALSSEQDVAAIKRTSNYLRGTL